MTYDVAIIGLGAVGSAAARLCTAREMQVLGFDRFKPPHTYGSSHGGSRIIRRAYFEGELYVPLLNNAYALWESLEEETGTHLFHRTGVLVAADSEGRVLRGAAGAAEAFDIPFEILSTADVRARFPAIRLRDDQAALWEPDAGWLHPERSIEAQLESARRAGADLRYAEPVLSWDKDGAGFRVATEHGTYLARRIILCAGGWMRPLLAGIGVPLTVERQVNVWYTPRANPEYFQPDYCPAYIWEFEHDHVLYGFPDLGEGVKAGLHHKGRTITHPDELDRDVSQEDVNALSRRLGSFMPDVCGDVLRSAVCFYTNTPDERYVIDTHPEYPGVAFASACSGHGFKASIAVGDLLAGFAADEAPPIDLAPFRLRWTDRNRGAIRA